MEKPSTKSKNKILNFLPKAAQAVVSFQNYQFSPSRDKRSEVNAHKLRSHFKRGFSGPIVPMIPAVARGKSNKDFETQEPTSPKISCMGQIKHKNKICKKKHASLPKEFKPVHPKPEEIKKFRPESPARDLKKKTSGLKKIFASRRKSDSAIDHRKTEAPRLTQMRRFASSRDTFANFDWKSAQFYSDEETGFNDGEDDVGISFSAPIMVSGAGGGDGLGLGLGLVYEPRKEINLWKRRTMPQPKPLQLDMVRTH